MKDDVYRHAMEIIKTEGIGGLTMEGIAAAVGVSRGTLYNYFDDKDAVVDFIEDRKFGPVLDAIKRVAASEITAEEKLQEIARWIFTAVYDDSALVLALSPTRNFGANRDTHLERRKRAMREIEEVLRAGIGNGVFKRLSPVVVAEMFIGAIAGMVESMAANGEFYRAEAVVPPLMEVFLGGLRNSG
jgi:AcrR family transcriptional regulator